MKATAVAPSNIALIKYWGKLHENLRIPTNNSISVNLSSMKTVTTVEFNPNYKNDVIVINGETIKNKPNRVTEHLDRIRKIKKKHYFARVESKTNFPQSAGLASSASGFAALTLAAVNALQITLSEAQMSSLARLGSGSACRSIPNGIVEWKKGNSHTTSYAYSLYSPSYLPISIIAVILHKNPKKISSTQGMKNVSKSIFFQNRLNNLDIKLKKIKQALTSKDLDSVFAISEQEALELHSIILTTPPFTYFYLSPKTIKLIHFIWYLRKKKIPVYFTIDAGPNVFILCKNTYQDEVLKKLKTEKYIENIIVNKPSVGARIINNHLF